MCVHFSKEIFIRFTIDSMIQDILRTIETDDHWGPVYGLYPIVLSVVPNLPLIWCSDSYLFAWQFIWKPQEKVHREGCLCAKKLLPNFQGSLDNVCMPVLFPFLSSFLSLFFSLSFHTCNCTALCD